MRLLTSLLCVLGCAGSVDAPEHDHEHDELELVLDVDETRNCGPVAPEHLDREVVTPVFGARVRTLGFDVHDHPDPACHLDVDSVDRGFQRAIDRWVSVGYAREGLLDAVARLDHIEMLEGIPDEDSVARTEITWTGSEDDFTYVVQIPLNPFLSAGVTHPVFCTTFQHELDHVFAWALDRDNYADVGHTTDILGRTADDEGRPYTNDDFAQGIPAWGDHCAVPPPPPQADAPLYHWGSAGDVPFAASFLGTGDDLVVLRPSEQIFYVRRPDESDSFAVPWGLRDDLPVVGDFLGRAHAQIAQYREGVWWILDPVDGDHRVFHFGLAGDLPFTGELLGPGRSDLAVFRPSDGTVWVADALVDDHLAGAFGEAGDVPFAGDFQDVGHDQVALYQAGRWTLVDITRGTVRVVYFGLEGDVPFVGRLLGPARSNLAVFRPSDGFVHVYDVIEERHVQAPWGLPDDVPVAGDFHQRGYDQIAQFRDGQWWILDLLATAE